MQENIEIFVHFFHSSDQFVQNRPSALFKSGSSQEFNIFPQ